MNAIVTIAMGEPYSTLAKFTHPTIQKYAEKIGAKFIVIDKQRISQTSAHFEKFQIANLLNTYNRIIYIDTDVIVREDCPNLFDLVPENKLGMFNEGAIMEREEAMKQTATEYGESLKNWNKKYYNSGVMVISRMHKPLFKKPEKELWNYYEQSYLNLMIHKQEIKMFDLDYRFNRMHALDKVTGEHRLCSYIVHYAGILQGLHVIIPQDLVVWESNRWKSFKKHLILNIGATRLGDNIIAEPVVRYVIENSPDWDISVVAVFPEVFKHLSKKASVFRFDDFSRQGDMPYLMLNFSPDEQEPIREHLSGDLMHALDYTSLVGIKRTLTGTERQIQLPMTASGVAEVLEIAGTVRDMVLIHPGVSWPAKTIPEGYWNQIIEKLHKKIRLGVIGNAMSLGRGVSNVTILDGMVDFRNLLSLEGLFALIGMAPVLITNDSAPLHAAGAFDNHIVLLPTCKHPDLILPYRKGSQYYKTDVLFKKIQNKFDPADLSPDITKLDGKIEDYLPDIEEVVNAVLRIPQLDQSSKVNKPIS